MALMSKNCVPLLPLFPTKEANVNRYQVFSTSDNTTSYVSDTVYLSPYGNRTSVLQATVPAGDSLVIQGRIHPDFDWTDIVTITEGTVLQEIVTAPMYRAVATNTSGVATVAAISI